LSFADRIFIRFKKKFGCFTAEFLLSFVLLLFSDFWGFHNFISFIQSSYRKKLDEDRDYYLLFAGETTTCYEFVLKAELPLRPGI
jgi:hypothetical protein